MAALEEISPRAFQDTVLLVAGDVADSFAATRLALQLLRSKFARVFFTPGNHDLWVRTPQDSARFPDSICKMLALWALCDELDVDIAPAEVTHGVWVVPLFSWYAHTFDVRDPRPGRLRFDRFCTWPISDLDVWQVMLSLNRVNIARVQAALSPPSQPPTAPASQHPPPPPAPPDSTPTVITMSHFLPRTELPFAHGVSEMAKAVGCLHLEGQICQLGSGLHVHGHTHISCDVTLPRVGPAGQGAVQNGSGGGSGTGQQQGGGGGGGGSGTDQQQGGGGGGGGSGTGQQQGGGGGGGGNGTDQQQGGGGGGSGSGTGQQQGGGGGGSGSGTGQQQGGQAGAGSGRGQQQGGQAGAGRGAGVPLRRGDEKGCVHRRRYVHHALDGCSPPSLYCVWVRGEGLVGETVPI
ncbi:MAG: hypothetical protein WDW38_001065 [Sanguina aurantia]